MLEFQRLIGRDILDCRGIRDMTLIDIFNREEEEDQKLSNYMEKLNFISPYLKLQMFVRLLELQKLHSDLSYKL